MRFEWDPRKAAINARKHGVSFEEAASCFGDPLALILADRTHSERLVLIGVSDTTKVLFVVYAELALDGMRIISARRATGPERRKYEEGTS